MKRNLFFWACALAACTLVFSCKKDKGNSEEEDPDEKLPPLTNVVGYWVGAYGVKDKDPNLDYAFLVNPDNTLIVYSQSADTASAKKAPGTWTFDPVTKKFTTYYVYTQEERYSTEGVLNHRSLIGTWGTWLETVGGGTYKVKFKQ
ncbi:MAG: hypothetical protein M9904_19095 [Chitinophagaceae bacterium]|nr:hypothetical protein [Chitinophagaceae bacterium]